MDTEMSVVAETVALKLYALSGNCSSVGQVPLMCVRVCVCESKNIWLSALYKKPCSRENSDWTEQSHFRSCAPQPPDSISSWRWQTDYISSVCRMQEPLSTPPPPSLRCQPVISRREEGGVAINIEKERLMGYWSTPAWSRDIHVTAWPIPNRDRCYEAAQLPGEAQALIWYSFYEQHSGKRAIL